MKIIFLNLADKHDKGLAHTTAAALRKKYPRYSWLYEKIAGANVVDVIDLFDLLDYQRNPPRFTDLTSFVYRVVGYVQALAEIRRRCREADKVMLGVHGHYGDADRGHASMGWQAEQGVMGTYAEFANLLKCLLDKGHRYNLTLVMCYGARSPHFQKDHTNPDALNEQDIKGSFAYKLFRELCREYDVKLTARTGAMRFNEATGASMVQTEAAVQAEAEFDTLERDHLTAAIRDKDGVMDRVFAREKNIQRYYEMETRIAAGGEPANDDERIVQRYLQLKRRANELEPLKNADQGKYGKFVYTYDSRTGHIVVTSKYPRPVVLYNGVP